MAGVRRTPLPGSIQIHRRSYERWAATLAKLAKTPKSLKKSRKEASDLEIAAALIQDFRADLFHLWETFTTERADVSRYLMDPRKETLVYLLGFHLANQARALGVLNRVDQRTGLLRYLLGQDRGIDLLDLGCGTGAMALTVAQELVALGFEKGLAIEFVDKSQNFLEAATLQAEMILDANQIVTRRQKLDEYLGRELALGASAAIRWIQIGYVWNELQNNPRTQQRLLQFLEMNCRLGKQLITIMEPANREIAREAMSLRDTLMQQGYRLLYPCPTQDMCPMLDRSRDWCYSEFSWERPPLVRKVDQVLEIDRHRIACAAYVFASPDLFEQIAKSGEQVFHNPSIVVGRPADRQAHPQARKFSYLLCRDGEGLVQHPAGAGQERMRGQTYDPKRDVARRESAEEQSAESGAKTLRIAKTQPKALKSNVKKKLKRASKPR